MYIETIVLIILATLILIVTCGGIFFTFMYGNRAFDFWGKGYRLDALYSIFKQIGVIGLSFILYVVLFALSDMILT